MDIFLDGDGCSDVAGLWRRSKKMGIKPQIVGQAMNCFQTKISVGWRFSTIFEVVNSNSLRLSLLRISVPCNFVSPWQMGKRLPSPNVGMRLNQIMRIQRAWRRHLTELRAKTSVLRRSSWRRPKQGKRSDTGPRCILRWKGRIGERWARDTLDLPRRAVGSADAVATTADLDLHRVIGDYGKPLLTSDMRLSFTLNIS